MPSPGLCRGGRPALRPAFRERPKTRSAPERGSAAPKALPAARCNRAATPTRPPAHPFPPPHRGSERCPGSRHATGFSRCGVKAPAHGSVFGQNRWARCRMNGSPPSPRPCSAPAGREFASSGQRITNWIADSPCPEGARFSVMRPGRAVEVPLAEPFQAGQGDPTSRGVAPGSRRRCASGTRTGSRTSEGHFWVLVRRASPGIAPEFPGNPAPEMHRHPDRTENTIAPPISSTRMWGSGGKPPARQFCKV